MRYWLEYQLCGIILYICDHFSIFSTIEKKKIFLILPFVFLIATLKLWYNVKDARNPSSIWWQYSMTLIDSTKMNFTTTIEWTRDFMLLAIHTDTVCTFHMYMILMYYMFFLFQFFCITMSSFHLNDVQLLKLSAFFWVYYLQKGGSIAALIRI